MKITTKTTKEQMKTFLESNLSALTDKNLSDRVSYALKVEDDKLTRKDLVDLVKEVTKTLGEKTETSVEPKAENSVKKLSKGLSKKQKSMEAPEESSEPEESEPQSEEVAEVEEKPAKKKIGKKSSKEKPAKNTKIHEVTSEDFPEELKVGDATYILAHDIGSIEDLYKALEKDEEIVFAFYYSKKMLKEAPYFFDMLGHPKSFDHDLDLATTIYVSEERKIAYHISMYTEGCYSTIPEDFEELDGVRFAGTMQFQIYRATTSTEEKTEA